MTTLDILIATIPHRHAKLCRLLAVLDPQMEPGVRVLLYPDNLEASYGDKNQALLEASDADYVVVLDDDDMVTGSYVCQVMDAIAVEEPDYVGYPVLWTINGVPQLPVTHSLRYHCWATSLEGLTRDITHKNPIRRDLALLGKWEGGYGADARWADQVRATGEVRTEAWIPDAVYEYRFETADEFSTHREPFPPELIEPLPYYPWLTHILAEPDDPS